MSLSFNKCFICEKKAKEFVTKRFNLVPLFVQIFVAIYGNNICSSLSGDLVDSVPNRFTRFVLVAENSDSRK